MGKMEIKRDLIYNDLDFSSYVIAQVVPREVKEQAEEILRQHQQLPAEKRPRGVFKISISFESLG